MPEIKNEIPSDEELYHYFLEHYSWAMNPDDKVWEIPELGEAFRLGCNEWLKRATGSIFDSMRRLNRLPREHSFWNGTNKRPTVYKLPDFCKLLLDTNPRDGLALWTLATQHVLAGANDFAPELWKKLTETGNCDIASVVYAALFARVNVGIEAEDLARLLIELNVAPQARPLLEKFRESENEFIAEWSGEVLMLIDNSTTA